MWLKSTFWRVCLVAFWIVAALAGALSAPRYEKVCEQSPHTGYEQCTTERAAVSLLAKVGGILNNISPAITGLATLAIAFFTVMLKRATDRQWQASEKAIVASQRAWLSIDNVWLKYPTKFSEDGITIAVDVKISNLGRSPATNIWVIPEMWFVKGPKHTDIKQGLIARLRNHGKIPVGRALFPQGAFTYGHESHAAPEAFQASISPRDDNSRRVGFSIFVGVSYRVDGDPEPHITLCEFSMLNTRMGTDFHGSQPREIHVSPLSQTIAD